MATRKRNPLNFNLDNDETKTPSSSEEASAPTVKVKKASKAVSKAREGKRFIGGYFSEAAKKQFQILRIQQDKGEEEMLAEALNDLFQKYGLSRIA